MRIFEQNIGAEYLADYMAAANQNMGALLAKFPGQALHQISAVEICNHFYLDTKEIQVNQIACFFRSRLIF